MNEYQYLLSKLDEHLTSEKNKITQSMVQSDDWEKSLCLKGMHTQVVATEFALNGIKEKIKHLGEETDDE